MLWELTYSEMGPPDQRQCIGECPECHDWECLVCMYDKEESGGLSKPEECPLCLGDTGRPGHIVFK